MPHQGEWPADAAQVRDVTEQRKTESGSSWPRCPVCDHLSGQDQGVPCSMCMDGVAYGLLDAPFLGENLFSDLRVQPASR